jgi:hypothetical protein
VGRIHHEPLKIGIDDQFFEEFFSTFHCPASGKNGDAYFSNHQNQGANRATVRLFEAPKNSINKLRVVLG